MDRTSDKDISRAIRKRILDEINRREQAQQIVNNVYGGGHGGSSPSLSGVSDQLGVSGDHDDPYNYFVDITRRDLDEINPATGKPAGWKKSVERYRSRKDEPERSKKKVPRGGS